MSSKPLSPEAREANRANAQKSTGPRTLAGKANSSRNHTKRGRYAGRSASHGELLYRSMIELGEDPKEYSRLQKELFLSFDPGNPSEVMLVEDLASLRWHRWRLERAQAALVARRVQELEIERQRQSLQVSQKIVAEIPVSQLRMGLIWAEDSPDKFHKLLEWLDNLKMGLELGQVEGLELLLDWIYGPVPTTRGAMMRSELRVLAEAQAATRSDAETESESEPNEEADPPANTEYSLAASVRDAAGSSEPHRMTPNTPLLRELLAEICNVTQQYQLYLRKNVEITPIMRQECLAPTMGQRWLMRQMNLVDYQIERKILLLRGMQNSRREQEAMPQGEEAAAKTPPGTEPARCKKYEVSNP